MQIRIVKSGPGCVYAPGSILKMPDKRAMTLIEMGYAEVINGMPIPRPRPIREKSMRTRQQHTRPPRVPLSPHMLPPRFICGCGFVAKDQRQLELHKEECG
jgi:hypothetical protein